MLARAGGTGRGLRAAGLAAALSACCVAGTVPAGAAQSWHVLPSSTELLLGSSENFSDQSLGVAAATPPKHWKTLTSLVFPTLSFAFGDTVSVTQIGTATGTLGANGVMTLDVPIRVRDSANRSVDLVMLLTTEQTNGTHVDGEPVCTGKASDPGPCKGTRRNAQGEFQLVAITKIPGNSGTFVDGGPILVELNGVIAPADGDGDGVEDFDDNCPTTANPGQQDADADGLGDVCDCSGNGGQDSDGDGVCNAQDNCPAVANPSQANADGDGLGDACDPCPNDAANDADGDGVCGNLDNCPGVSNPTQADGDGDGAGNACDGCPADAGKTVPGICGCGVPDGDGDGDGVPNCDDLCPSDPGKTAPGLCGCGVTDLDSDGDGAPDCQDLCPTDPQKIAPGLCDCGEDQPGSLPAAAGDWDLDEGGGTTAHDDSGNGNHGALVGTPSWTTGVAGAALACGSGRYAVVPDDLTLDIRNAITLVAWVRPQRVETAYLVKKARQGAGNGYELALSNAGKAFVRFNQATAGNAFRVTSAASYPADGATWTHLAATFDGATIRLYVNGEPDGSLAAAGLVIGANNFGLGIGAQDDGVGALEGAIDGVRVFPVALTAEQVALAAGADLPTWYRDFDGDGFGNPTLPFDACAQPPGHVADATDCNDADSQLFPGNSERCDGQDNDCDALVDDADPGVVDVPTWYRDADGDGFGDPAAPQQACARPLAHVAGGDDCDDADAGNFPGNAEVCDDRDNDCDGVVDPPDKAPVWYSDADGDGFGDPAHAQQTCDAPDGYVTSGGDCDDTDPGNFPGNVEVCDERDNDCDGLADNGGDPLPLPPASASWPLDEGAGTAARDGSGNANDGAFAGAPAWIAGLRGNALQFGAGSYVVVPDHPTLDLQDGITLMAWVRPSGVTTADLVKKARQGAIDGYELSLSSTGRAFVRFNEVSAGNTYRVNSSGSYPTDGATWMHLAATFDGSAIALYVDGVLDASLPAPGLVIATNNLGIGIGAQPDGARALQGAMDEVRIFSAALSAAEIAVAVAGSPATWYPDADGDGFGDPSGRLGACARPPGYVQDGTDCNDDDPGESPGSPEVCDGIDNDCDGLVDDADPDAASPTWHRDADGDGFGDPTAPVVACFAPADHVADAADCDDLHADSFPGGTEVCDDRDNDCDGLVDEIDADGDGLSDCDDPCPDDPVNDPDGDQSCGGVDNCPTVHNPDQGDADGDGLGDACDAQPSDSKSVWTILAGSGSTVKLIGATAPLVQQAIALTPGLPPQDWRTLRLVVFPLIDLGFSDLVELEQIGSTSGSYDAASGMTTLDLTIRLTDSGGASATFAVHLTTEQTNGTHPTGVQACKGQPTDPTACKGTRRNPVTGALRLVGIAAVPAGSGTAADRALLFVELNGSIPRVDTDGDGVEDFVDNCPAAANPGQADADQDGRGDACDICPNDATKDSDGDGICGSVDNCPTVANPTQANADGDALGDACDPCPADPANDADGDGVCGSLDNCPNHPNPGQQDSDSDGSGDACDPCTDRDGDGYGSPGHPSCPNGAGDDCDDARDAVHPLAFEACDGLDDDCDLATDEALCEEFDVNADGRAAGEELAWLGRAFGRCSVSPAAEWWQLADYTKDGCIDGDDLAILAAVWGCTAPAPICD